MLTNKKIFFFFLFIAIKTFSQENLSLQQAIEVSLKNNFSIQIAKTHSDISCNDVTLGNAGMLPQVNASVSGNSANNNTHQQYASGLEVNKSGVGSSNINSGIFLNWTLFDGMKMFAKYDMLKELKAMGELQLKIEIENNIAKIINGYYDVVRQKQLIEKTSEAISLYEEREKITQMKLNVGSGSKLEVRQAQVDMNAQKSQLLKLQTAFFNAKANLNQLLSRSPETDFTVNDSIVISYDPKFDELKTSAVKQNNTLLFSSRAINVSSYSLKEIKADRFPKLGVNASYVFSHSENQAGFILLNQNLGFNAGLGITWNLFNGFEVNRQVKDLQLQLLISKTQYEMTKLQLNNSLVTAYRNFQQSKELLKLEEENTQLAKENADVALESYRIGKISALELKDVQKSFDEASVRLVNARYDAKSAETELMRLNGMLVK